MLGHDRLASVSPEPGAEDWYANLVWIERRKRLFLTHSGTLFSVFSPDVRAGALRTTGALFAQLVATALADEGLPGDCFGDLARLDAAQLNQTLHRIIHRARDYEPPIDAVRERLGSD